MRRAALFVALLAAAVALLAAGCGSGEEKSATPETVVGTLPEDTSETVAVPTGDAAAGKQVFESAGCGGCHTLSDAGASGSVGPNLDEAKPSAELVFDRVTNGSGAMPSFKDQLSEQQIADVTAYVVQATSGS